MSPTASPPRARGGWGGLDNQVGDMSEETLADLLATRAEWEQRVEDGGGKARQARQRRLGRLTARDRIAALLDADSFVELGRYTRHRHAGSSDALAANRHPGDGLVCGFGTVEGRDVAVYAHDPTVLRGALGHAASKKLCRLMDLAAERGAPLIAFADSDGVRIPEGTDAIEAYGEIIDRTVRHKGRMPQLTLVCGICVGAAAYTAALTDAVGMIKGQSFMFITGPKVTEVITGEAVSIDELGGPALHATKTGACHAVLDDEAAGVAWLRALLGYFEHRRPCEDAVDRAVPKLEKLIPVAQRRGYDVRKVLAQVFDQGSLTELSADFARNLVTAFARLGGRSVALVASQPQHLAGCLDIDASRKGAAFVRWASDLGLPVLTFVDVPGYLPGRRQEEGGILPFGAELLSAYGNARVPRLCLVVRKSYGGASVLSYAADVRLALPTAQVAPMGAEAAIEVALGPVTDDADADALARRETLRAEWRARHGHVWAAAEEGYFDLVVAPADVRAALHRALSRLDRP